jgi:ribosomal protein S12 methylthiotransferase
VLVDEIHTDGAIARSYMDAPEIDGLVHLTDEFEVKPGDKLWVQIIHSDAHDLWGVRVED